MIYTCGKVGKHYKVIKKNELSVILPPQRKSSVVHTFTVTLLREHNNHNQILLDTVYGPHTMLRPSLAPSRQILP